MNSPQGGQVFVEASVVTPTGVLVADQQSPELCIEVVSPSNSRKELQEKIDGYLATGALEVWIVYPQSRRCEHYGREGLLERSAFAVDLAGLFDAP